VSDVPLPPADPAPFPRRLLRAEQVIAARTRRVALVLEGSQDPHNVNAVLRTAEAVGVQDVHLVAPRRQAAHVARGVTLGAHRWLTLWRHDDVQEAVRALRAEGRTIWAAHPEGDAEPLGALARDRGPVAVVLGNETEGLTPAALALADRRFRIDLVGFTASLNLSVAAAITLWELRRVEVEGGRPGDLSPADAAALRAQWYAQLLGRRRGAEGETRRWLDQAEDVAAAAARCGRVEPVNRERAAHRDAQPDGDREADGGSEP
jgi:tRNA (guanosine-2'-O-)-methyltransferase